jgi:subtilisin family serine protease
MLVITLPRLRALFGTALSFLLLAADVAAAASQAAVPGELIVRFKPDAGPTSRISALARVPAAVSVSDLGIINAELVRFSGMNTDQAIAALQGDPRVLYAEPNYEIHLLERVPNDPRFPELYGMRNVGQTGGLPGADIRATQAWDLYTGDPNLKVGVIDTGIDWTHPDLAANVWTNPGEIPGNGIDDDHNGYVDDIHGYDFVNNDGNPMDDHGHGTHVSGTIAAVGDNAIGVVGVNWHLKIVGIKFLSAGGSGTTAGAIAAIQYAIRVGVRLTSNSWGGGEYSAALLDAINAAGAAGQLFVAAAGNASSNMDLFPSYPAGYDSPYIISVGATDDRDRLASFSNYGVEGVDLAAPGVNVLSTLPGANYGVLSGTSMATPHVSGVVALAAGRFPGRDNLALKQIVLSSCDSIPTLVGLIHGARRLNAYRAILLPDSIPPAPVTDLAVDTLGSTAIGLTWTATGDDSTSGSASAYDLRYSLAPIDSTNFASATRAITGTPQPAGATEHVEVSGLTFNTNYYFALEVLDDLGNPSPVSNLATGMTLGIPHLSVSPTSMNASLLTGDLSTQRLTVSNTGAGRLDFTAPTPEMLLARATALTRTEVIPDPVIEKGGLDPRPGILGGHGPDRGGYRWRSSDDPSGRRFDWVDISSTGTAVELASDDAVSTPIPLGFEFPYYGQKQGSVRIGSNGYLTFGGSESWFANSPLPTASVPADLVAPWWQDLGNGGPRAVLFRREADRFIVSYLSVPTLDANPTRRTFQVILESSGRIVFQYLTLGAYLERGTVGIQDPSHSTGLLVAFNAPFVHDRQAIEFLPLGQWLRVSPTTGRVPAGGSLDLEVTFDANGLFGGDYAGAVLLNSNDPGQPLTRVPASLHVTGAPDIALSRDTLDFKGLFIGATRVDSVRVTNAGTDVLHVSSVTCSPAVFTVPGAAFDLPPGSDRWLPVTFTPTVASSFNGTLVIASDDHDEPSVSVRLLGTGLVPPDIAVTPDHLSADLFTGQQADRPLTIANTGGSELDFKVSARHPPPASPVMGAPVAISDSLRGPTRNTTNPHAGAPVVQAIYTGAQLSFGISDLGEVMPFQYPVGNEHLARGSFIAGYTVAYEAGGVDRLAFSVYDNRSNVTPFSYRELENSATRAVVEVVTHTADGYLSIRRLFTFVKDQKFVTVESRLENLSGQPATRVVFKEDADWDADGQFYDTWDYDRDRHLVYASLAHFVGIASEQAPDLMDINGWNDILGRNTFVDIPSGPVFNYDGLEVLHFELGALAPAQTAEVKVAYGAGNTLAELRTIMDEAVGSPPWLTLTPAEGVIPAGGQLVVNAHFNAAGLLGGSYPADVHVTSNDPDESDVLVGAVLRVTGAPDIAAAPDSLQFGYPFAGTTHTDTLIIRNEGTDNLVISAVATSGAPFFTTAGPGTLAPGASRAIAVSYAPTVRGAYRGALVITSNDVDEGSFSVPLSGFARVTPEITVSPTDLSADLLTGDVVTRTISISNSDAQELFWASSIGTPSVVATSPVFGASPPSPDKSVRSSPPPPPPAEDLYKQTPAPAAPVPSIHAPGLVLEDGTLEQALANLDAGAADIGAAIPGRFDFSEGVTGSSIVDGGNDMYDGGNFLSTELGTLNYSDGVIVNSGVLGPSGRYFTRKYPGLFLLVADHDSIGTFAISGNLGADGAGSVDGSILQVASAGVNYRAFVKRVYGAGDPSVNHMVIVADAPSATQAFSTNSDDDFHSVTGLASTRRLYYLLYAGTAGGYIDDPAALQILKTFLRVLHPQAPWLDVIPSAGVMSPRGHADVTARFRAAGLVTGDYASDIHIESDDADHPDVVIHAHLHVTGAPDIAVAPDSLAFDTLFVGVAKTDTVVVTNQGTDVLSVTSVTASPGHFLVPGDPFTLAPGDHRILGVTFAPTSAGSITGTLSIQSNDHDQPVATVSLRGEALVAPDILVSPDSLVADLFSGDTSQTTVTVRNRGGSNLIFQVVSQFSPDSGAANTTAALAALLPSANALPAPGGSHASEPLTRTGERPVVRAAASGATTLLITTADVSQSVERALVELGQPYDYVFTSSFAAVPLAPYHTIIVAMDGGDPSVADVQALAVAAASGKSLIVLGGTSAPSYYDGLQTYLLHHTGQIGWTISNIPHLTVTAPLDPLANALPSPNNYSNASAAFYMLRALDADAEIVAVNGDGHPALLHKGIGSGSLVYFMNSPYSSYWGATRDYVILRQVVQNALAWSGSSWLSFVPSRGTVVAGAQLDLQARFDARHLLGGDYRATVHVRSNDPDQPDLTRPAHLHVTGAPDIAVTPDSLAFGSLFVGASRTDTVTVNNVGTDVLHVTQVLVNPAHFQEPVTAFDVAAGAKRKLVVTFAPTAPGVFDGTLVVVSDDHDEPSVTVHLAGTALVAPDIAVTPDHLAADLLAGEQADRPLTILNTGGSDLAFHLGSRSSTAASPAPGTPAAIGDSLRGPTRNTTNPHAGAPVVQAIYTGAQLSFGISDLGEVMPFQYPVGNEHLARGSFIAGYTVAYEAGGVDRLAFSVYDIRSNVTPFSYRELENSATRAVVEVVTHTGDGLLAIRRLFTFVKDQKFVTVESRLENLSGASMTRVVFKEDADWDADGQYSNTWDYDRDRHLVYASLTHFVGIASEQAPDLMDIYGWNDYSGRNTFVDIPSGPVFNYDGLEVLHFELGTLAPAQTADVRVAYGAGNTLAELQSIMDVAVGSLPWLTLTPNQGTVPAGGQLVVNAHFNSAGLLGGVYPGTIQVLSNDPDESPLDVPVSMHVIGAPRLVASRDSIGFGTLFVGQSRTDTLSVSNPGTDLLSVTSVTVAPDAFTTDVTPFTLAPGARRTLVVRYAPATLGVSNGALTFVSNDPSHPTLAVALSGTALPPPIAGIAPDSLHIEVAQGGHQQATLTLSNTGGSDLTFSVATSSTAARPAALTVVPEAIRTSKTLPSAPRPTARVVPRKSAVEGPASGSLGAVLVIADGGTEGDVDSLLTSAGYSVTQVVDDSNWDGTNPSPSGFKLVVLLDGPGVTNGMPAGGQTALKNFVAAGGGLISTEWLAYEVSVGNYSLMQALIPLTWGDFAEGLFTWSVVHAHPVTSGVSPEFNVSTTADIGTANSGTVLVASSTGYPMVITKSYGAGNIVHFSCAGNYFGYRPFTVPDMQRLLLNSANWLTGANLLTVAPSSGSVPAHASLDLTVSDDPGVLPPGTYYNSVFLATNDPVTPSLTVPVTIVVVGAAAIALSPDSLASGSLFVGKAGVDSVQVSNPGSVVLHVTSVAASAPFSVPTAGFDLAGGGSRWLPVTFAPTAAGPFRGQLTVNSSAPGRAIARMTLVGIGIGTASADLAQPPLSLALYGLVPNPPVHELMVSFTLPDDKPATVELLDLAGRRLREVAVGAGGPGRHTISLGAVSSFESGVYLVRLRHGGRSLVKKCVLTK